MAANKHAEPFPRAALLGAAAVLALTLLAVAGARMTGVGVTRLAESEPVSTRALRFSDREDGAVVVFDVEAGRTLEVLAPGTHGFVRGVLRGLARERLRSGVGEQPPFLLTRWADGRLSLNDPVTGRQIALEPFGPTNAGSFARLLDARVGAHEGGGT